MGARVLAIECATEACSAALFDGEQLLDNRYEVIGRGHAERLVPMIAELPDNGRADHILVSLGPGSFTGVRIGLAAARALGLAWEAEILGYPTLALIAAMAQRENPVPVTICMTGGHGEWFIQDFEPEGVPGGPLSSLTPADAAERGARGLIAGSQAEALASATGERAAALPLLPDAAKALLVPPSLLVADLAPLYGRPPDARLPGAAR